MAGLRIGIDVGGTFTHGVVLRQPGVVIATSRTPTTHTHEQGVAAGVQQVLSQLLEQLDAQGLQRGAVELVAHSTTQATNALLEGDVAPVTRIVVVPPGELGLCRNALKGRQLDIGSGHSVPLQTRFLDWSAAGAPPAHEPDTADRVSPAAVIQPLAGGHELREHAVAEVYRAAGRPAVCASDITQVLGLAARARTATVNASMLPKMLATAEFTAAAVHALLPGVPLQVVRSDGGAMSLAEMRRLPVLSLLSGPAAGASAALHRTGLSEVVFLEVGGTSTDITLIREGRVRHRYATVGGQRLMVPALDLRTIAVGGGSMLRAGGACFGPRSAHIAGLPYLFQALMAGKSVKQWLTKADDGVIGPQEGEALEVKLLNAKIEPVAIGPLLVTWSDMAPGRGQTYIIAGMDDGSHAALTLTDCYLSQLPADDPAAEILLGGPVAPGVSERLAQALAASGFSPWIGKAQERTWNMVTAAVQELARSHGADMAHYQAIGGGGGAPVVLQAVADKLGVGHSLVADHTVISAIGAALAVNCVSLSKSVAQPTGADIAALLEEAGSRLRAQGAERVSTDYEYDPHRQVLTVTARGSRPYEQSAQPQSDAQLAQLARGLIGATASLAWDGVEEQLWVSPAALRHARRRKGCLAGCALDRHGRALWVGWLREHSAAAAGALEAELQRIIEQRTQYTDGGPALPGLALLCAGRLIPLDQLGSKELTAEIMHWENLPPTAPGCFLIRA